jgi:antibiotic biosynthesis monooxygenase (ABM) superfamily enzyme
MKDNPLEKLFYSSLVTEHIVPKGRDFAFKRWHNNLVECSKQYDGFLRCDLCPPLRCKDQVVKWYYITHFDSPEHLNQWMESSDRKQLLESGQEIFSAYRFKSFTTGLEGWFSMQSGNSEYKGLGPPRWKQILAVVLGLYPVVMIQAIALSILKLMQSWSLANSMIVNNLITSIVLSFLVMPFVSQQLSFWLQPAYLPISRKTNLVGTIIVLASLGLMVIIFNVTLGLVQQ